jgi:hypothetical protein
MQGVRRVFIRRNYTSEADDAGDEPSGETRVVKQENDRRSMFRRTYVRRSRASICRAGLDLGRRTVQIQDPDVRIYQNPRPENCSRCLYRRPCIVGQSGDEDLEAVLAAEYRTRTEAEFEEERLRWSAARKGTRASLGGVRTEWRPPRPDVLGPLG